MQVGGSGASVFQLSKLRPGYRQRAEAGSPKERAADSARWHFKDLLSISVSSESFARLGLMRGNLGGRKASQMAVEALIIAGEILSKQDSLIP